MKMEIKAVVTNLHYFFMLGWYIVNMLVINGVMQSSIQEYNKGVRGANIDS